jgi:hypothetical protein
MGTNLTRRQLLVLAQGGVAAGAFGGCAVLRGGASHPVLAADKQSLEGNALRIPVSQLAAVGPGQVLEVKPGAGRPDVLLLGAPQGGP